MAAPIPVRTVPRPGPGSNPRVPARRLGGGRLAAVLALLVVGVAGFLLLMDVVLNQDSPQAPWFTAQMRSVVAGSIAVGVMALALSGQMALLLPPRQADGAWAPTPCPACGNFGDPGRVACASCGAPF